MTIYKHSRKPHLVAFYDEDKAPAQEKYSNLSCQTQNGRLYFEDNFIRPMFYLTPADKKKLNPWY